MSLNSMPIYLINIPSDHERRLSSLQKLQKLHLVPSVIPAYNGHQPNFNFHYFSHLSAGKWWENDVFKPGAFCCFLSHVKTWKRIENQDQPNALILEDDFKIDEASYEQFKTLHLPDNFDIIFVNLGVRKLLDLSPTYKDTNQNFILLDLLLLELIENNMFNDTQHPGSYGYIVSKQGASKLLKMTEHDKICMGVDYAMFFNSLSSKSLGSIATMKNLPNYLKIFLSNLEDNNVKESTPKVTLNTYLLTLPSLISHEDDQVSSIKHEILVPFNVFSSDQNSISQKEQTLYDLFGFDTGWVNYLVNISEKYKYIYFETPKVACSTIKKTLQKLEVNDLSKLPKDVHEKSNSPLKSPLQLTHDFTEYLKEEYFKFGFVRNPYTRILSCYLDKISGDLKTIFLPKLGYKPDDNITFELFLLSVQKQRYSQMNHHWQPQHILLGAEHIELDFIGKQEHFTEDFNTVLSKVTHMNTSSSQIINESPHAVGANEKLSKYLTPLAIQLINDIYDEDFKRYGYKKEILTQEISESLGVSSRNKLEYFEKLKDNIKPDHRSPDILREVALVFEQIGDINTAARIMEQAHYLRPGGPFINKKLKEYRYNLQQTKK